MPTNETNSIVEQQTSVELDLDNWLTGAESTVNKEETPTEQQTPNFFSKSHTDLSFLDNAGDTEKKDGEEIEKTPESILTDLDESLHPDENKQIEVEEEDTKSTSGRPKSEKNMMVSFFKEQIESGDMFAFDDYDESKQPLDEYLGKLSEKDLKELYKANVDNIKQSGQQQTQQEFFESLPEEFQYAYKYFQDGGTDVKGILQALAQVREVQEMTVSDNPDQIAYQYLKATKFGSDEEIQEQIDEWKDLGSLEKRAEKFKPKLDSMQEEMVQQKIAEQESIRKQNEQLATTFVQNVFEALRPGEISGIKLDRKTQSDLYNGLTQAVYPSISGRPTNEIAHLIEKYQFVEPDPARVAAALWLLKDPEGYHEKIRTQGGNKQAEETVRMLKTEQGRKSNSSVQEEPQKMPKLTRPRNIFQR